MKNFRQRIQALPIICFVALATGAAIAAPPARYYRAQIQILLNDSTIAYPGNIVLAYHPVTAIFTTKGKLYKLKYTIGDSIITSDGTGGVWLNTKFYLAQDNKWIQVDEPKLALLLGRQGSVSIHGQDASKDPGTFGLKVAVNRLSIDQVKVLFNGKTPPIRNCALDALSPAQVRARHLPSSESDGALNSGMVTEGSNPGAITSRNLAWCD